MEDLDYTISPHLSDLLDEEDEELEQSRREQNEKEWMALCWIAGKYILMYYEKYLFKEPCRTSRRSGYMFIQEILQGNETRCYENFRLKKEVFVNLFKDLNEKYGLKPTRGMSIHEMLGMFLMTYIFQHSGETVHRHFHSVLKAVSKLARDIIKPHLNYNDGDCIGALDGTHVKARLPQGQQIPYIGRKGYPTQNIFAVVNFNMCFTFAWVGWEGAAHDSHIFGEALHRMDAGYAHMKGYMASYKGDNVRYHLHGFRHIETFNYMHSSCRNIVESTFGVWKARYIPSVDSEFGTSSSTNNIEEQSDTYWMGLRDMIANEIGNA
ncbi:hypothetical protein R3W88_024334 [Solanum pinnatisectum]|uniref:DDE Tnp4 domain-containing protein n=1 Tax=Solanum pinnatisectum TaxID=50273 RepID=A0AAV9M0A3_9SOLN|nr:hypothetical protein R3W88_024334 [Solanum pinnatisectum]